MPRTARQKQSPDLETRLGYTFRRRALLTEALTHSSARSRRDCALDNERLEFLGDRVLGLCVARLLLEHFPDAREGDLARRFNRLVRMETCAAVARELQLGPDLILDAGEAGAGGRRKDSILADACEAVLGAIFLDGGFEPAQAFVERFWTDRLKTVPAAPVDAKTALQEWAQARKLSLPSYRVVGCEGPDHAPEFEAEVQISGLPPARGQGASKRVAEQAAAAAMLKREGVWQESSADA
jgi:ribonuclease-3